LVQAVWEEKEAHGSQRKASGGLQLALGLGRRVVLEVGGKRQNAARKKKNEGGGQY